MSDDVREALQLLGDVVGVGLTWKSLSPTFSRYMRAVESAEFQAEVERDKAARRVDRLLRWQLPSDVDLGERRPVTLATWRWRLFIARCQLHEAYGVLHAASRRHTKLVMALYRLRWERRQVNRG